MRELLAADAAAGRLRFCCGRLSLNVPVIACIAQMRSLMSSLTEGMSMGAQAGSGSQVIAMMIRKRPEEPALRSSVQSDAGILSGLARELDSRRETGWSDRYQVSVSERWLGPSFFGGSQKFRELRGPAHCFNAAGALVILIFDARV